ncbi:unnamed protein product [Debaryomyces tyrocola]|nr:unnamed protein product [Debaryomyces tyrocola]
MFSYIFIIIRYSVTASTVRFHRANPGSTPGIGNVFFYICI